MVSEDNTTCTTKCEYLNQLSNILTHKCVSKCPNNLFYNPELMTCDDKCKEPYKYFIDYKNNTKKCVKKCDESPFLVEDEDNFECLPFNKFKIMSIESKTTFYLNNSDFPKYFIKQGNIENFIIRVNFNQNIRKRINLINGQYERIPENNNSIIISIKKLKKKQIFNFKDNVDNSYDFGFEVELKSDRKNIIILILIIFLIILLALLIIITIKIYCCKINKNKSNLNSGIINDISYRSE